MQFKELFIFGKIVFDDFSSLYDTDKIQYAFYPKRRGLQKDDLLKLGLDEGMFYWRYSDYALDIGFYGVDQKVLKIELVECNDWDDEYKASMAWWKPLKSITCKTKDDVTKAVTEMLEYVRKQTGVEKK